MPIEFIEYSKEILKLFHPRNLKAGGGSNKNDFDRGGGIDDPGSLEDNYYKQRIQLHQDEFDQSTLPLFEDIESCIRQYRE